MGKNTSPAAKALAERQKQAEAFVNGGTLLEQEDPIESVETTASENGDESDNSQTTIEHPNSQTKPAKSAKRQSKSGHSHDNRRPKKGVIVEHPALRKALSKSRVQKTIRIPPMVMVEYEELCTKLEIEVDFNNHINEALVLWLEKNKK